MPPDPTTPGLDVGPISALLLAMRRRWWVVLALIVVTFGAALLGVSLRSPSYTATARILVTPFPQQADSTLASIRIVRDSGDGARNLLTATALLTSSQNATVAAQRLKDGTTPTELSDAVRVEAAGGSDLVAIDATAETPERAAELANAYAAAALAVRDRDVRRQAELALAAIEGRDDEGLDVPREQLRSLRDQGDPTLSLAQRASAAEAPANGPGTGAVLLASVVLGVVLGGLGAVLLERGDRRVRSRDELLQEIPVPMLVGVPEVRGARGIDMPPAVREAFRTLQLQLEMQRSPLECRRVLVTSASSGDGKTTAVLNLAFALVSAGQRVVAISTLDDGIHELRRTIHELFRTDHADVGTKLRQLGQTVEQRRDIVVELHLDPELASLTNDVLVGIVGELLTNAVKHAKASAVMVVLARHDEDIRIVVRDDGVGMTLRDRDQAIESGHIGLSSIDRRVRALGGRWRIRSAPGRGTSVTVELPH